MRSALAVCGLVVLAALAVAETARSQPPPTVAIENFAFRPAVLRITIKSGQAGQEVHWMNTGSVAHTVTADRGVFDSKPLPPGAAFSFTFNAAGTFEYHCEIHPAMRGSVVVEVQSSGDSGDSGGYGY